MGDHGLGPDEDGDVTVDGMVGFLRKAAHEAAAEGEVDGRMVDGVDPGPGGFVVTMSNGQAFVVTVREARE